MHFFWSTAALASFIWLIYSFGIEFALVVATIATGLAWIVDRLFFFKKRQEATDEQPTQEPLIVEYAKSFFPVFFIVLLLRSFIAEPFRIPSGSMMPTLLVGDFILVNKFAYGVRLPVTKTKMIELDTPESGDVVVFRYPMSPSIDYIKRIVGVPGDKISYKGKTPYINGGPLSISTLGPYEAIGSGMRAQGAIEGLEQLGDTEHSILVYPRAPDFNAGCQFLEDREVIVPEGHYFVMGDNRDDSNDSRCWGLVPDTNLVGKAFVVWMSWDLKRSGIVGWSRIGNLIN